MTGEPSAEGIEPRGRLHPFAILLLARRLAGAWIVPILVVLFTWRGGIAIPALAAFAAAGVAFGVLAWLRFSYAVIGDRLEVRSGVLQRTVRIVPIDRIRGIDVTAPALHRLLGLVRVEVEAAAGGRSGAELSLSAVSRADGEALRARLLAPRVSALEAGSQGESLVLYHASPRLLVAGGVTSGKYLLAPLVVLGIVWNLIGNLPGAIGDRLSGRVVEWIPDGVAGLLVVVPVALVAAPLLAVLGSLLVDWRFTVRDEGDRLVAVRGLLTQRAVSIDRLRIRGLDVTDSPLRRAAGLAGVAVVAGGLAGGRGGRAVIAPVVGRSQLSVLLRLIDEAAPDLWKPLTTHPGPARTRRLVRALPVPMAAAVVAGLLGFWWLAGGLAGVAVLCLPLALDRYRQLGHAWNSRRLVLREGSLTRRWTSLDPSAIVGYEIRRSPGQQRAGLCTIVLHLGQGAGRRRLLDIGEEQAQGVLAAIAPTVLGPLVASR